MSSRENCYTVETIPDLYDIYSHLILNHSAFFSNPDPEENLYMQDLFISLLIRVAVASDYALQCYGMEEYDSEMPELKRRFELCHDALNKLYSGFIQM